MVIGDDSCAWASLGFVGVMEGGWDNAAERARLIAARDENGTRRSGLRHAVAEQAKSTWVHHSLDLAAMVSAFCPCFARDPPQISAKAVSASARDYGYLAVLSSAESSPKLPS